MLLQSVTKGDSTEEVNKKSWSYLLLDSPKACTLLACGLMFMMVIIGEMGVDLHLNANNTFSFHPCVLALTVSFSKLQCWIDMKLSAMINQKRIHPPDISLNFSIQH